MPSLRPQVDARLPAGVLAESGTHRPEASATSGELPTPAEFSRRQRELVVASLLACPDRD
jgi:hypothetical protein